MTTRTSDSALFADSVLVINLCIIVIIIILVVVVHWLAINYSLNIVLIFSVSYLVFHDILELFVNFCTNYMSVSGDTLYIVLIYIFYCMFYICVVIYSYVIADLFCLQQM